MSSDTCLLCNLLGADMTEEQRTTTSFVLGKIWTKATAAAPLCGAHEMLSTGLLGAFTAIAGSAAPKESAT